MKRQRKYRKKQDREHEQTHDQEEDNQQEQYTGKRKNRQAMNSKEKQITANQRHSWESRDTQIC